MKLYLISRKEEVDWDETAAVVVAASSSHTARRMIKGGTENRGKHNPWLDPEQTTCKIIADYARADVKEGVVLEDFRAG